MTQRKSTEWTPAATVHGTFWRQWKKRNLLSQSCRSELTKAPGGGEAARNDGLPPLDNVPAHWLGQAADWLKMRQMLVRCVGLTPQLLTHSDPMLKHCWHMLTTEQA